MCLICGDSRDSNNVIETLRVCGRRRRCRRRRECLCVLVALCVRSYTRFIRAAATRDLACFSIIVRPVPLVPSVVSAIVGIEGQDSRALHCTASEQPTATPIDTFFFKPRRHQQRSTSAIIFVALRTVQSSVWDRLRVRLPSLSCSSSLRWSAGRRVLCVCVFWLVLLLLFRHRLKRRFWGECSL